MFSAFARINLAAAVLATAIVVFALSNGIGPFGPAFAGKETYFASIALFKLLTHFLFCVRLIFFVLMATIVDVAYSSILDRLEVLGKSLKGLFVEFPASADVFDTAGLVEWHIGPFHLKFCAGRDDIAPGWLLGPVTNTFSML